MHRQVGRAHGHPRPIRFLQPGAIGPRPRFHGVVDGDLVPIARGLVAEVLERSGKEIRRAVLRGRMDLRPESAQLSGPVVQEQEALGHEIRLVHVEGRGVAAVDVPEDVPVQEVVHALDFLDFPRAEVAEEGVLLREEGFLVAAGTLPRGGAEAARLVEEEAVEVVAPEGAAEAVGFRGEEGELGGWSASEDELGEGGDEGFDGVVGVREGLEGFSGVGVGGWDADLTGFEVVGDKVFDSSDAGGLVSLCGNAGERELLDFLR